MDNKTVIKNRAARSATDATQILDRRFSKHEGELRDTAYEKSFSFSKTEIHKLSPQEEFHFLSLAHVRQYGKEPRCEGRNSNALFRQIQEMSQEHGTLVWLRQSFPQLDHLDLLWSEGRRLAVAQTKRVMYGYLAIYGKRVKSFVVVIQRDAFGRVHIHAVTHLSGLSQRFQAMLRDAPSGKDGGTMLTSELHGVIVGESDDDREAIAKYMSKFHDERITLPSDDPMHLQLLDEVAQRMIYGEDDSRIKLIWRLPHNWRPGMKPPT